MKKIILLVFIATVTACDANPSSQEVETKLKAAMTDFLYQNVHYDSSKVKYRVEDVTYYDDDRGYYDCEFRVRMSLKGRQDTVGKMFAFISKEFKVIKRNY